MRRTGRAARRTAVAIALGLVAGAIFAAVHRPGRSTHDAAGSAAPRLTVSTGSKPRTAPVSPTPSAREQKRTRPRRQNSAPREGGRRRTSRHGQDSRPSPPKRRSPGDQPARRARPSSRRASSCGFRFDARRTTTSGSYAAAARSTLRSPRPAAFPPRPLDLPRRAFQPVARTLPLDRPPRLRGREQTRVRARDRAQYVRRPAHADAVTPSCCATVTTSCGSLLLDISEPKLLVYLVAAAPSL